MQRRMLLALGLCAVLVGTSAPIAGATEVKLVSAGAMRSVVSGLADSFSLETGHSVSSIFGTVGVVRQRISRQPFDVVIASDAALDEFIKQGVVTGERIDLGRT